MDLLSVAVLLFDDFETLDAMGPVEVFGCLPGGQVRFLSRNGGKIISAQGATIETEQALEPYPEIILLPGGLGTRRLVQDDGYLAWLQHIIEKTTLCMTVCTGSALLAKTPLLDGLAATSNKLAFEWVISLNEQIDWKPNARWVRDGKFYTSSGISAGIDMALQVVADFHGYETAQNIAKKMEYLWNDDADNDPFAHSLKQ